LVGERSVKREGWWERGLAGEKVDR